MRSVSVPRSAVFDTSLRKHSGQHSYTKAPGTFQLHDYIYTECNTTELLSGRRKHARCTIHTHTYMYIHFCAQDV
jgi:hypothetical protein